MRKAFLLGCTALLLYSCGNTRKATSPSPGNQAAAVDMIKDKRWVLRSIYDSSLSRMPRDVYITFKEGGHLEGNSGCNGLGGNYELNGQSLKMSQVIGTKMWCEDLGPVEQKFLKVLDETTAWQTTGEQLQLLRDKKTIATLEAVYLK